MSSDAEGEAERVYDGAPATALCEQPLLLGQHIAARRCGVGPAPAVAAQTTNAGAMQIYSEVLKALGWTSMLPR